MASDRALLARAALWVFVVGIVSDKAATEAAHRAYAANAQCGGRNLPDLALDALPDWSGSRLPDYFLAYVIISFVGHCFGPRSSWVLARALVVYGFILLFRALTIVSTSYSAPGRDCQLPDPGSVIPWRWWGNSFFFCYRTCGDYMYSGHTCTFVITSLVHTTHLGDFAFFAARPRALKCALAAVWLACALGVLSLLLCRFHYMSDVLVGAYVSSSAFALHRALPHLGAPPRLVRLLVAEDRSEGWPTAELNAELRICHE